MKDARKLSNIQLVILLITSLMMVLTVALQLGYFNLLRHIILCSCILLLLVVTMIFDVLLKNKRDMFVHGIWGVIWILNLVGHIILYNS